MQKRSERLNYKRSRKKRILKTVLPCSVLFILTMAGIIYINIINTRTLCPLGDSPQNYDIVNEKFGSDFSSFIKDNAKVRIYDNKEDEEIILRIGDEKFTISKESWLLNFLKDLGK